MRSPGNAFFFSNTELIPGRRRASPKNIHSGVAIGRYYRRARSSSLGIFAPVIEQRHFPRLCHSDLTFNTVISPSAFILQSIIFLTRYVEHLIVKTVSFYGYFNRRISI